MSQRDLVESAAYGSPRFCIHFSLSFIHSAAFTEHLLCVRPDALQLGPFLTTWCLLLALHPHGEPPGSGVPDKAEASRISE